MSEPTPAIADCNDPVSQAMDKLQRSLRRLASTHHKLIEATETLAQNATRLSDLVLDITMELPPGAWRDDDE